MSLIFTENFQTLRKWPLIPSLFYKNRFITNFKEKTELFNSFFCKQCSFIASHSKLPTSLNYVIGNYLSWISIQSVELGKIIVSLDSNKACGHGNISIRMLKIFGDPICKHFEMIIWSTRHCIGVGSGLLIRLLEILSWFCVTCQITLVLLTWRYTCSCK